MIGNINLMVKKVVQQYDFKWTGINRYPVRLKSWQNFHTTVKSKNSASDRASQLFCYNIFYYCLDISVYTNNRFLEYQQPLVPSLIETNEIIRNFNIRHHIMVLTPKIIFEKFTFIHFYGCRFVYVYNVLIGTFNRCRKIYSM